MLVFAGIEFSAYIRRSSPVKGTIRITQMGITKPKCMKKQYLLSLIILTSLFSFAQQRSSGNYLKHMPAVPVQKEIKPGSSEDPGYHQLLKGSNVLSIGNTYGVDYQTYNSGNLMNRTYEFPDGTIGATWMHKGQSGVPDRGSAYNYFNGTDWGSQNTHLGPDPNNAFPSYAPWGPNGELVVHYRYIANDGPLKILRRENKGVGEWQEFILNPPDGNHSLVWHSAITSGENHEFLHILALVYDDPYQGQEDALLYYRSPDGGETWDINGVVIEGLGPDYFPSIPSLKYSWAQPVGNTIAFTFGFDAFDGLVFKSYDNGTTWEKIVVYQSPYSPLAVPELTPRYGCGDGTSAIVLDSEGKAHVVFCRMIRLHDLVSGEGWYYVPLGSEGVIYWNEDMPALDSTAVSSYTLDFLEAGGNLVGWITPEEVPLNLDGDQPNYGVGLTSHPHLGIDAEDNLYLVYTALAPEFLDLDGLYYYRHIYSNASFNGGANWSGPQDLTHDEYFIFSECVFPAIAPKIQDQVHLVFQEDYTPGNGQGFGLGDENLIDYMSFETEFFVGIKENDQGSAFQIASIYPNPVKDYGHAVIRLSEPAMIKLEIVDLAGKVVQDTHFGKLFTGSHTLKFKVDGLVPGMYFACFSAGNQKKTASMIIR